MPAAPRARVPGQPQGQPEEAAGGARPRWDTSNPAACPGQKRLCPCSRTQPHAAPLLPQLPSRALESYGCSGCFPGGRMTLVRPRPLSPFVPPCSAQPHSSRGWKAARPAGDPGPKGDPSPVAVQWP